MVDLFPFSLPDGVNHFQQKHALEMFDFPKYLIFRSLRRFFALGTSGFSNLFHLRQKLSPNVVPSVI